MPQLALPLAFAAALLAAGCSLASGAAAPAPHPYPPPAAGTVAGELASLRVQGRAPKTGYSRARFGPAWSDVDQNGCDTRDDVLHRDLRGITTRTGTHGCVVLTGTLDDPYTGRRVLFAKSHAEAVQIDHVVALSDAWQTGAQQWSDARRLSFANDLRNLQATDGPTNQRKGNADAASWLPPNRGYRCTYVRRQVDVKAAYGLWVTPAEHDAMARVLATCGP